MDLIEYRPIDTLTENAIVLPRLHQLNLWLASRRGRIALSNVFRVGIDPVMSRLTQGIPWPLHRLASVH